MHDFASLGYHFEPVKARANYMEQLVERVLWHIACKQRPTGAADL